MSGLAGCPQKHQLFLHFEIIFTHTKYIGLSLSTATAGTVFCCTQEVTFTITLLRFSGTRCDSPSWAACGRLVDVKGLGLTLVAICLPTNDQSGLDNIFDFPDSA